MSIITEMGREVFKRASGYYGKYQFLPLTNKPSVGSAIKST